MQKDSITNIFEDNSYPFFLYLFVSMLLAIPVASYFLGNAWLCFGILIFLLSSWLSWIIVPSLFLYSMWLWSTVGFSISQYGTFFLLCSIVSFILFTIARKKIFTELETEDTAGICLAVNMEKLQMHKAYEHLN